MAILTNSGRAAIAKALAASPLHFAWGSGDAAWGTTIPPESLNSTSLVSEIGRRIATSVQFVVPDDAGDIEVPLFNDPTSGNITKRFRIITTPSPYLYMRFIFDFADAPASIIREVAIFTDTAVNPTLPVGQRYFSPADIVDTGNMLALENLLHEIVRTPNSRQSFEFVLTI